jgi:uncharacterized protein (DUF1919 family)
MWCTYLTSLEEMFSPFLVRSLWVAKVIDEAVCCKGVKILKSISLACDTPLVAMHLQPEDFQIVEHRRRAGDISGHEQGF